MSMSYIGSSFPGGKDDGFFDLFTRGQSDAIVKNIAILNGMYGSFSVPAASELRELHRNLPPANPAESSIFLLAAHALFQKNGDMISEIDPEKAARESFYESERTCESINAKFIDGSWGDSDSRAILSYACNYVAGVLGNAPKSLSEVGFRFGPGANVSDVGVKHTSPNVKLSGTLTFSNSLLPRLGEVRDTLPLIDPKGPVCGCLEFVPKNFKTHRSIMVEPGINAGFQLGLGSILKRKLFMHGIDLTDQSCQRERARLGSLGHDWCTIDLSRASDSISYMLVMNLLPWDWFDLLDSLRTPMCKHKGKFILLEKFSSMGNGYTFELETLIFKAIIVGISTHFGLEDNSSVYGDDITCSSEQAGYIYKYFPDFGFAVNVEKSFVEGPFREACGGDYRNGVDIRPWFLRSNRDGGRFSVQKLFSFHNFLQRKPWFDPDRLIRAELLKHIPKKLELWGPDGFGDGHLVSYADPGSYLPSRVEYNRLTYCFKTYAALDYVVPQEPHTSLAAYVSYAGLSYLDSYDFAVQRTPKDVRILAKKKSMTFSPRG